MQNIHNKNTSWNIYDNVQYSYHRNKSIHKYLITSNDYCANKKYIYECSKHENFFIVLIRNIFPKNIGYNYTNY